MVPVLVGILVPRGGDRRGIPDPKDDGRLRCAEHRSSGPEDIAGGRAGGRRHPGRGDPGGSRRSRRPSVVRRRRTSAPVARRSLGWRAGSSNPRTTSGSGSRRSSRGRAELQERDEKLQFVREQLEKAADQHRAQLERIAGMTSHRGPRAAGGAGGRGREAGGHDPGPGDRAARPGGGRRARSQDRDDRDPAGGLRADGRVHGVGVRASQRGHEGPHHRPGGAEHPRVRGDHGREPHHRRHARGRGAVVLRSRSGARRHG